MAQKTISIKGTVKDAKNGEVMPFASVFLAEYLNGFEQERFLFQKCFGIDPAQ